MCFHRISHPCQAVEFSLLRTIGQALAECWRMCCLLSMLNALCSNPLAAIRRHASVTLIGQIPGFGALDVY